MGLFDIFKSKEQKEFDKTMEDMLELAPLVLLWLSQRSLRGAAWAV